MVNISRTLELSMRDVKMFRWNVLDLQTYTFGPYKMNFFLIYGLLPGPLVSRMSFILIPLI